MQSFLSLDHTLGSVPGPLVKQLSLVDISRGREELFRARLPDLLVRLAQRARVASITASSALEGVIVPDENRASRIIHGKVNDLRTRSEQELAGYRNALDYVFAGHWQPLNVGLILHLHRLLFAQTTLTGGEFKIDDNLVVDRHPDGPSTVRFVPVTARRTPFSTEDLVDRYNEAVAADEHHPVLLVGLFVLDLLTIHPFADGNGRVVRIITNALLADAGYDVGRFISIEQLIAEHADGYYDSLLASTHHWHENEHDPWPWLTYFTSLLVRAYARFEDSAETDRSTGSKQDRVRLHVLDHGPEFFTIADIRTALPGVSDGTIRLALNELKADQKIVLEDSGRNARWRRRER